MYSELNDLVEVMQIARTKSDFANNRAYELRQNAIRLQFIANAAIETAAIAVEVVKECMDPQLLPKVIAYSKEAAQKAVAAVEQAAAAAEEANNADKWVTQAFQSTRDVAARLSESLKAGARI